MTLWWAYLTSIGQYILMVNHDTLVGILDINGSVYPHGKS